MLTNEAEFEVLLARYDDDPAICSKILRNHSLTDPAVFLTYAQKAILNHPVTRALKFVTGLALAAGLMDQLIELHSKARSQCMELAQKLMACDPRFDLTFLEFLQRPRPSTAGEENLFHIGLDILDLISQGDRLVPGVLKVLKHPNPKVRSKAALFIGGRTQNLAWAASRTQEYDARVRANIIESLIGINSDFVYQIFRNNVADENNRVAANAILGLYLLGDTSSIPLILDLAKHPDARFRNSCAWVMGRTGDPRFAQSFSELMNDPDELVRAQAFKGLGEIRKALRASAARPELRAGIVKLAPGPETTVVTTVMNEAGQAIRGIPATSFIIRTGSPAKPVRHFAVEEFDCRSSLNVAFVLCLPNQEEAAAGAAFIAAIEACAPLRRSKDRWAILKISPNLNVHRHRAGAPPPKSDALQRQRQKWSILHVDLDDSLASNLALDEPRGIDYSNTQTGIDAMLRDTPIMIGPGPADDAARVVINSLLRGDTASGNPHLIFFGAGPEPHLVEPFHARGSDVPAVVHILAQSSAWQTQRCYELSSNTSGFYRKVDSYQNVSRLCLETYSSLLHNYRITCKEIAEEVDLDIRCEEGRASASYELGMSPSVPEADEVPHSLSA